MNISSIRSNLTDLVGEVATTFPETWIMSWAMLGLVLGVALYSAIGYGIGAMAGHALWGSWAALGFYAYCLAQSAETINANIDVRVDMLRQLR